MSRDDQVWSPSPRWLRRAGPLPFFSDSSCHTQILWPWWTPMLCPWTLYRLPVSCHSSHCCDQIPNKTTHGKNKERSVLAWSFKVQSIMVGVSWQPECETADDTVSLIRMQRWTLALSCFLFYSVWDPNLQDGAAFPPQLTQLRPFLTDGPRGDSKSHQVNNQD